MPGLPFFNLPYNNYYSYYRRYNNYIKNYNNLKSRHSNENNVQDSTFQDEYNKDYFEESNIDKENKNRSSKYNFSSPSFFNFDSFSNSEEPIIEFMGIKLYLDDLLIIGLLFVLYQEGVKDEILFISLILLLLS